MGALKFITLILSLFGKKNKKEKKLESIEEMKLQDSIRREERSLTSKEKEKWHQSQQIKQEEQVSKSDEQVSRAGPYNKVIRMLRTEKKRQRILARKAELEEIEKKRKEESLKYVTEMKRKMNQKTKEKKERQRQLQRLGLTEAAAKIKERRMQREATSQTEQTEDNLMFSITIEDGPYLIKHRIRMFTVDN